MRSQSGLYIGRLDHLRFFAASLVVLYHVFHRTVGVDVRPIDPLILFVDEGHTGVSWFLVISGFIFATLAGRDKVLFVPFIFNRVLRIYPLLIFAVMLGASLQRDQIAPLTVISNLLLPLSAFGRTGPTLDLFPQLWTVLVEFQVYLLFPFMHRVAREDGSRYLFGIIGLMVLARLLAWLSTGSAQNLGFWTIFGRLDQFVVGMLLAQVVAQHPTRFRNPLWLAGALALAYAMLFFFDTYGGFYGAGGYPSPSRIWILRPTVEGLVWGFVVVAYLQSSFSFGPWINKALDRLGEVSYSIYVMHLIVMWSLWSSIAGVRFVQDGWWNAFLQGALLVLPATCAVSFVTYHFVERPFLRMRRRYLVREAGVPAATAPPVTDASAAPATSEPVRAPSREPS